MAIRGRARKGRSAGIPYLHIGSPSAAYRPVILAAYPQDVVVGLAAALTELEGYYVLAASCGCEALRISRAFRGTIDLAIADADLPGLSCTDLCSRLFEERPGVRMLVTSGSCMGTPAADGQYFPSSSVIPYGKLLRAKVYAVLSAPAPSFPYVHMVFFERQPADRAPVTFALQDQVFASP